MTRVWKLGLLPLLLYVAGFCALTWPAIARFSTHFMSDRGDGWLVAWDLWWVRTAILERGTHFFFTDMLHHPTGVTLLGQTLTWFNGLLAIPLAWFLSEVQTYNAIVVFALVMSGWTTFLLAHHVSGSWIGSAFAGTATGFSSYCMAHAEGHLYLISLWGLPLFLLAWIRFLERPTASRALAASTVLLAATGCDWYYGLYATVVGAILFPFLLRRNAAAWRERGLRAWGALALFLAASAATTGVLYLALWLAHRDDPFVQAHDPREWSLDPASLLIPGGHWRFSAWTRGFWGLLPGNVNETSVHLGWCVIVAAAFALWAHLRGRARGGLAWALVGTVFFAFALGPTLHFLGQRHAAAPMPYTLLERLVPAIRMSGMPIRMVVIVHLCASILAAIAFDDFVRTVLRPWPLRVVFAALFALELLRDPLPATLPERPDHVEALARLPDGAVFGLNELDPTGALYHQTIFAKPVIGGYTSRVPQSCADRYAEIVRLFAEGRTADFFAAGRARYVVLRNEAPPPVGLKAVFAGERCTIYVAAEDRLEPTAPIPEARGTLAASDRLSMDDPALPNLAFGWFPPERAEDGPAFRWTGPRATFVMVAPRAAQAIRVHALPRPLPATVRLRVDGFPAVERLLPAGNDVILTFPLGRPIAPDERLVCTLEAEGFRPVDLGRSTDARTLGVRVAAIVLE
jgi:hypothetical protein